jgi:predicted AAA+ superfamily ATPase
VTNYLLKRSKIELGTEQFGNAFESFILQELIAHRHYSGIEYAISCWRTASQLEVDFILGNHEVAIEVKGSKNVNNSHLKGLKAFMEEYAVKKALVVCNESLPRIVDGVEILPYSIFLERLWAGKII